MQVDAVAALAPVLARFAIVVDGPLEAEVLGRLVAGGDRATTLADLARPFPGRGDLARPDAVAVARGLVTRLLATGTVEHVGGGYRIADPALAAHLGTILDGVVGTRPGVAAPAAAPLPLAAPGSAASGPAAASEDASRLLQQVLAARATSLPAPAALPAAAGSAPPVPGPWEGLVRAGWSPTAGTGGARALALTSASSSPALAHVVVADPASPAAGVAGRLGAMGPTHLAHVGVPPVTWGQVDARAARAAADALGQALGGPAPTRAPLVVDRGLVPALAVLARDGALPGAVVVDLRSGVGRALAAPPPATGPVEPSVLAAAMAAAAGARAPTRRSLARPRRGGADLASLLEVLFGPWGAASSGEEDPDGAPSEAHVCPAGGVVVTARTDDPQADALGAILGVEVVRLGAHDDLLPEVLAWLEDEHGQHMLAPRG